MNVKPNEFQRLIHRLLMLKPVSAFLARVLHHADAFLLRLTHDRHSVTEIVGLPVLQLFTTGAKTRQTRRSLLAGLPDGERIVLIASNFGRKHHPGWYYNLKANPECKVRWNGGSGTYLAREAQGEERAKYWQLALSYYAGYEKYERRASHRRVPVMVLEPAK